MKAISVAMENDGNCLLRCFDFEVAVRLLPVDPGVGLPVALTHGMAPFEELEEATRCVETGMPVCGHLPIG